MVQNIMILPTPPRGKTLIAARLCNFLTGDSHPLHDHETWINNEFRDKVDSSPDLLINIQAFASKRGSESFNQTLSERRLAAVKASITAAIGVAKAKFTDGSKALGESVSAGGENNDDGYWRAVEVYAFGSRPPAGTILPIIGSPPDPDQWFVSNLSLTNVSFVDGFGVGGFWGPITFQQGGEDGPEYTYRMRLAGVAAGESAGLPPGRGRIQVHQADPRQSKDREDSQICCRQWRLVLRELAVVHGRDLLSQPAQGQPLAILRLYGRVRRNILQRKPLLCR